MSPRIFYLLHWARARTMQRLRFTANRIDGEERVVFAVDKRIHDHDSAVREPATKFQGHFRLRDAIPEQAFLAFVVDEQLPPVLTFDVVEPRLDNRSLI